MNEWQQAFQAATTSTAFYLQLSKNMVAVLADIDSQDYVNKKHGRGGLYDCFIPAVKALERRGLVQHNWPGPGSTMAEKFRAHQLTPAGKHVLALCRLAGLLPGTQEADDAVQA